MTRDYKEFLQQETDRILTELEDANYLEELDELIEPSISLTAHIRKILGE